MPYWTRRVVSAALTAVALPLGLAACAPPAGVDGHLVNAWAELPEPEPMRPDSGVCHNTGYRAHAILGVIYLPVDCDEPHQFETAYVGDLPEQAAERSSPPEEGTSVWRELYADCDQAAADYLGADFRTGYLWLGVSVPNPRAWEAGARWFRCDLRETLALGVPTQPGSRQGVLVEPSHLHRGCYQMTLTENPSGGPGGVSEVTTVDCADPHNAVFVGVIHWDGLNQPRGDRDWGRLHRECRQQMLDYLDVTSTDELAAGWGTVVLPSAPVDWDWDNGDRGMRCHYYQA